jgi:hypothetical protein
MYQKDYILRMIEMLGELLRAIFGLLSKKDFTQAEQKLSEAYISLLRNDASFFHRIPADQLTTTLLKDHHYTNDHLLILAELFNAEAVLRDTRGEHETCLEFYDKSLILFTFVEENDRTWSESRLQKMKKIRMRIDELNPS